LKLIIETIISRPEKKLAFKNDSQRGITVFSRTNYLEGISQIELYKKQTQYN